MPNRIGMLAGQMIGMMAGMSSFDPAVGHIPGKTNENGPGERGAKKRRAKSKAQKKARKSNRRK